MKPSPQEIELESHLRACFAPDTHEDIVAWLETNVKAIRYSPKSGSFRCDETPWLRDVLRAAADPEVQTMAVMAPIQSGKSLFLELLTCYIVAKAAGPTLCLQDKDENAEDWFRSRLIELWKECPPVWKQYHEKGSNAKRVQFDRMMLWCLGARNERNLQRRSIRWLIGDECWQYPQGHLVQASRRVAAYEWMAKKIFVSQGGIAGDDFTELFNSTDRREWTFACPHCGTRQRFMWEQIRFPEGYKEDGKYNFKLVENETRLECVHCKTLFADHDGTRAELNATGAYQAMNGNAVVGYVGFHWNALAVRKWGTLATEWLRAKQYLDNFGDEEARKNFKQAQMALPWSDEPDELDIAVTPSEYHMESDWDDECGYYEKKAVPANYKHEVAQKEGYANLRFLTVDVQQNGFYVLCRKWNIDGRSRLHGWMFVNTWEDIWKLQVRWKVAPGFVFVDSGFQTDDVYRQCARFGWNATKGASQTEFPWRVETTQGVTTIYRPVSTARQISVGGRCKLYLYSNLSLKDTLTRLRKSGRHSFAADCGDEYTRQMASEHRTRGAGGKPEWQPYKNRANHLWDCEVMGLVAPLLLKMIGKEALPIEETV